MLILLFFSLYDIRHHRIRNSALFALLPWCLISIPLYTMQYPQSIRFLLFRSLLGFLSGGLLFLAVSLLTNGSLGGGDIKLIALLGIIYGAFGVILISVFASLCAAIIYGAKAVIFKKKAKRIPFVPYLCFGSLVTVFLL